MSDETQAGQEPPVNPPSTQAGQDPPVQSPTQPQPQQAQPDLATLQQQLAEARKEAAANRVAANELKKRQDAELSEQQRKDKALQEATDQLPAAQARARGLELQNHLLVKATEYGIKQNAVALVLKALDQNSLYGDDGTLDSKALKEQITSILKDVPELAVPPPDAPQQPSSNASSTNPPRPANSRVNEPVDLSKPPGWGAVFGRKQ